MLAPGPEEHVVAFWVQTLSVDHDELGPSVSLLWLSLVEDTVCSCCEPGDGDLLEIAKVLLKEERRQW
jgi:hypothetical protein